MKKITSILLSLVLVLGCAAMAFAVPADIPADTKAAVAKGGVQVTIFGDLRFRGTIYKNTNDFSNDVRTNATASGWVAGPNYLFATNNAAYAPYLFPTVGGANNTYMAYTLGATTNQPVPAAWTVAYGAPLATALYGTWGQAVTQTLPGVPLVGPLQNNVIVPAYGGGTYVNGAYVNLVNGYPTAAPIGVLNNVLAVPTYRTAAGVLAQNGRAVNTNVGTPDRAYFESRVRIGFDIAANANTTGRILLEAGSSNSNDNMPWGSGGSTSGNNGLVAGDAKANEMRVLEAWLQHKGSGLFGVPAYFKIGHMPIRVANGLFYSHTRFNDDAIVLGIEPIKGFNADFAYIKNAENNASYDDDQDTYSLMLNYQIAKNSKIGADVSYVHTQNGGAAHAAPGFPSAFGNAVSGFVASPLTTYLADTNLWNFGINGKTDFGVSGLEVKLDAAFQTGKVKDRGLTTYWANTGVPEFMTTATGQSTYPWLSTSNVSGYNTSAGYGDVKLSGWAMTFDASYQFKPVKILAGFGYGSGEDQNIAPADPRTPWIKSHMKNRTFQTTLEGIPHYTFVYEYFTPNAANTVNGGLQNTWYLKLGASADITKDLYADMTIYYLRAVKNDPYTNPYGFMGKDMALMAGASTGYNILAGVPFVNTPAGQLAYQQTAAFRDAAGNPISNNSKNIGIEVDANVKYKIDKNLTYYIEGGYLFAGNFWRNVTGVKIDPATGIAGWAKVDDAYAVRSGFQLTF